MKNAVIRSFDGRVQGGLAYWFHNEEESWKDEKIKADAIVFPSHKGKMHGECVTYHISQLNVK